MAVTPDDRPDRFAWAGATARVLFALHAVARHRRLFLGVWLGIVGASAVLLVLLPRTYDVQTVIQVSPTEVIQGPVRSGASGPDNPGKNAGEWVLRRENLVALVQQTDLLAQWPRTRAPLSRLKDAVSVRLFGRPSDSERVDAFVGYLEKQLWVDVDPATVTIGIHFPDPRLAVRIVEAAEQNYLEARQVAELSSIGDAIAILERRTAEAQASVETALARLEEVRRARGTRGGRPRLSLPDALDTTPPDRASSDLLAQVEAKRRAIAELEEARRRRASDLAARIDELKTTYSESHPLVLDAKASLQTLQTTSPQVGELRRELGALESEVHQRGLLADVPLKANRSRDSAYRSALLEPLSPLEDQDPQVDYAKAQLRHALTRYDGLQDKLDGARLALDGARAAFKYRYVVIRPAQRPRSPAKPRPALVLLASAIAGAVLGMLAAAWLDVSGERLLEDWQASDALGLPVLGSLRDLA